MIFPPHFFISTFISMVSLAHYKIDYKSPLTLYPRWCSWVVYPHCVVSLLSYHTASLSSSYTRRISSYNKCVCILIIIIVIIFIVIVIVVSSSSSSLLSYPRCMHCRRQLANLALFIFLPRHVRTMSWPHYKVASILDVTCCVIQPCYVHARRRHVSPFIAPRRYYCLSFLPLHHPLIVGCCVIHVVCVSFMSVILPRMLSYHQLTTHMLTAVGKPAPRRAPSKWTWSGMYKLSPVPV
jgi:hypothetical protein